MTALAIIEMVPRELRLKRRHWQIGNSETRKGIAFVFGDDDTYARLFAAAPELLEALRELLAAHTVLFPAFEAGREAQDDWARRHTLAERTAEQVIDKATTSTEQGGAK